jgi:hypothetical protein
MRRRRVRVPSGRSCVIAFCRQALWSSTTSLWPPTSPIALSCTPRIFVLCVCVTQRRYDGEPSVKCVAHRPQSLLSGIARCACVCCALVTCGLGMNQFLQLLSITCDCCDVCLTTLTDHCAQIPSRSVQLPTTHQQTQLADGCVACVCVCVCVRVLSRRVLHCVYISHTLLCRCRAEEHGQLLLPRRRCVMLSRVLCVIDVYELSDSE